MSWTGGRTDPRDSHRFHPSCKGGLRCGAGADAALGTARSKGDGTKHTLQDEASERYKERIHEQNSKQNLETPAPPHPKHTHTHRHTRVSHPVGAAPSARPCAARRRGASGYRPCRPARRTPGSARPPRAGCRSPGPRRTGGARRGRGGASPCSRRTSCRRGGGPRTRSRAAGGLF
ncbi:hypothetical protein LY76DRAFT_99944 [Colletotrichum caudatum]|nr:hypothetical protein LY76DRAFT_99944 [Colletotrichum caudatum]